MHALTELGIILLIVLLSEPGQKSVSTRDSNQDLSRKEVWEFLRYNKEMLEEYVLEEVPQDSLERWIIRKAKTVRKRAGESEPRYKQLYKS